MKGHKFRLCLFIAHTTMGKIRHYAKTKVGGHFLWQTTNPSAKQW